MELTSKTEHILTFTSEEKAGIVDALYEVLTDLFTPDEEGKYFNWKSDPKALRDLYDQLREPGQASVKFLMSTNWTGQV